MDVLQHWPGLAEHLSRELRGKIFQQLVGAGDGRRLLDLGAGPCLFARRAMFAGWKVTAVDARTVRVPDEPWMEFIEFVEADVREFDVHGYDVVAILGLLYHLHLDDQQRLLARCSGSKVIVETQVHTPGFVPPAAEPWGHEIITSSGFAGVSFPEGDNPMASVGNPSSFWHTEPSLLRLFEVAGFASVTTIEPAHYSKYGTRKFYVLEPQIDPGPSATSRSITL